MQLPFVNYYLHLLGAVSAAEVLDKIFPVGVCVSQGNAGQFMGSNGLPGVVSVMMKGLTDTYNLWGSEVKVDTDLYFVLKPKVNKIGPPKVYVLDDENTPQTVDYKSERGDYYFKVEALAIENGKQPPMETYSTEIVVKNTTTGKIYTKIIFGHYWRVGRVNQRNNKFYQHNLSQNQDSASYNTVKMKSNNTFEIMLEMSDD